MIMGIRPKCLITITERLTENKYYTHVETYARRNNRRPQDHFTVTYNFDVVRYFRFTAT